MFVSAIVAAVRLWSHFFPTPATSQQQSTPASQTPTSAPPATKNTMARERTYIMIKPDGVQRGLVGEIIRRFEQKGFKLVALKLKTVSACFVCFVPGAKQHCCGPQREVEGGRGREREREREGERGREREERERGERGRESTHTHTPSLSSHSLHVVPPSPFSFSSLLISACNQPGFHRAS